MKREFLKSIEGLTDDAIDKIMAEVGKDIEKEKAKATQTTEKVNQELENLKNELNSKDELIANYNSEIEKFKGMDIDSIKNKVAELEEVNKNYETQLSTSKEEFAKQLKENEYNFAVKEFVSQHKFTNDFVKEAFVNDFKSKGFKLEEGKFLGADDYIKQFSEKNQGVFVVEEPTSNEPQLKFSAPTGGQATEKGAFNFGFNTVRPVPKE